MMSRAELTWEVNDCLSKVRASDLTDKELAALLAAIRPVRDRLLANVIVNSLFRGNPDKGPE